MKGHSSFKPNLLLWLPVCVAVLALVIALWPKPELTLEFSEDELQQRMAAKFPLKQELFPVSVTYSDPVVHLDPRADRIGFSVTATARFLEGRISKGRLDGNVMVRFDPDQAALFFDDAKVTRLEVEGIPAAVLDRVTDLAGPLVRDRLNQVPVYRLQGRDLRQNLAQSWVKGLVVKDGRLRVTLGPRSS